MQMVRIKNVSLVKCNYCINYDTQFFRCLNRLNIFVSFQGMLNTVNGVSEFHDIKAQYWSETVLEEYLMKQHVS